MPVGSCPATRAAQFDQSEPPEAGTRAEERWCRNPEQEQSGRLVGLLSRRRRRGGGGGGGVSKFRCSTLDTIQVSAESHLVALGGFPAAVVSILLPPDADSTFPSPRLSLSSPPFTYTQRAQFDHEQGAVWRGRKPCVGLQTHHT